MSKPILEFLEALGVNVKKGAAKMECPSCHELKLTASEKKNVASCWSCGKKFIPGNPRKDAPLTWQTRIMKIIAARCQKALSERQGALNYLVNKRHLPNDIEWLKANFLGAVPADLPVNELKKKAGEILAEDMKVADATAKAEELPILQAKEQVEILNIERFFSTLDGVMNSINVAGAVAFIYTNHHGHVTSINFRLHTVESEGKAKQLRRIQAGTERGLFNPKVLLGSHWEELEYDDVEGLPPIVVEGEFNWLSLLAINDKWAGDDKDAYGLMGCAMGGKDGCDGKEVLATFTEMPLVIYDNDTLQEDGFPAGYDLVRGITKCRSVLCCATIGAKDLDELCVADNVNKWQLTEEKLLEHWRKAVWVPRPYEEVGKELNAALGAKPGRRNYSAATQILWRDIEDRGECFRVAASADDSFSIMVVTDKDENLKDKNRIVQVLKGHSSWVSLMLKYGVGASDAACEKLGIETAARIQLEKKPFRELHVLSHYNRGNKCMYIDELTHTLKLHPNGKVSYIQNGEEGVIFTPAGDARRAVIGELGSLRVRKGEFTSQILDSVRWDGERGLSVEAGKQLYKMHVVSIFFDTLMEAKAVPAFEGKAGGGKNTISNLTGRIFEGNSFHIDPMPDKPETLDTLTVDRLYCAFDEWDSSDGKMEKAFKSWCTRSFSARRELYRTWDTSVRPLARGMAVSTNYNPSRDVATGQRQLMFTIRPRQDAMNEECYKSLGADLYPEFMKHRAAIWSEIVADLRAVVVHIANTKVWPTTSFRMADFATLMLVGAIQEGWGTEARNMLFQMQGTQLKELASKHMLVTLMTDYLITHPNHQGRFLRQNEWQENLRLNAPYGDKQAVAVLSEGALKKMLTGTSSDIMKTSFIMCEGYDKKYKQKTFSFTLKPEDEVGGSNGGSGAEKGGSAGSDPPNWAEVDVENIAEVYS